MSIILQFFPNGEFSQGVDTSSNRPSKHVCKQVQTSPSGRTYTIADIGRAKSLNAEISSQTYNVVGYEFVSTTGVHYILKETTETHCVLQRCGDVSECNSLHISITVPRLVFLGFLSPLVHQSLESCERPESRKKLLSMTKRMARNIRNGVYLLEQEPGGKDVLSFLTLTLPSLSPEGLESCCRNWDSMVKRFFDWLRIRLKAHGVPLKHVYCTEIQSKRLQQRGEYAPHLHIVFQGKRVRKSPWIVTPQQARKAWARCIRAFADEPFDTSALENLQRIKYSAARYLGKYLSKGRCAMPQNPETSPLSSLRTQWGGMAKAISKRIRQATQRFAGGRKSGWLALCILNNMEELLRNGCVIYFKRGFIPLGEDSSKGLERGLHVGCGCLRTPTYEGGLVPVMRSISALPYLGD